MAKRTGQIAPAPEYQGGYPPGEIEQTCTLEPFYTHNLNITAMRQPPGGGNVLAPIFFDHVFLTILELLFLALVPLLNRTKKTTDTGIDFGSGITFG
jgi:hypothetical protein